MTPVSTGPAEEDRPPAFRGPGRGRGKRGWRLEARGGLVVALCEAIDRIETVAHAFSTRCADGGEDFDLGHAGPVSEVVGRRRLRLAAAAGLGHASPVILRQVHEAAVVRAAAAADGTTADAAVWSRAEGLSRVPSVRTADCVPILIVDRAGRVAAAVHAGWRGTAEGVAGRAIEALRAAGACPGRLVAALGPAILPCCYEVEVEVLERVAAACPRRRGVLAEPSGGPGRVRLDLHAANRLQLEAAGLPPDAVHAAPWCTRCRGDLFFSFRRNGPRAGRQMAVIGGRRP